MRTLDELGISPAPWKASNHGGVGVVLLGECAMIAEPKLYSESWSNARLISAAPELYEALRGVLEIVCDDCKAWRGESREECEGCPRVKAAYAALAKASGESEIGGAK